MKLNDKHIGALLCLGLLVIMAIAGTVDYHDAVHFDDSKKSIEYSRYECDTTETAYDVLRYVEANNVYLPQ